MPTVHSIEDGLESYDLAECAQGPVCKWEDVKAAFAERDGTIASLEKSLNTVSAELAVILNTGNEQLDAAQARIDSLMFEYCPQNMTQTQIDTYANHQSVVPEGEGQ